MDVLTPRSKIDLIIWLDSSYNQQNLSKTETDFKWYLSVRFFQEYDVFAISDKASLFMAVHSMAKGIWTKRKKHTKKQQKHHRRSFDNYSTEGHSTDIKVFFILEKIYT